MIKLNVSAANIAVEEKETLTEGRVGLLCQFRFTGEWTGLAKTAVFDGADSRDVILKSDTVAIPAECLSTEGYSLSVGVYGKNSAGDIVIPTVYATVGKIQRSAYPSGREPAAPTPDVVAQIQQAAANAEELARSVREDADLGRFQGAAGQKGDKGDKGDTGPAGPKGEEGGWYTPAVTQPDANTMRVAFSPSKKDMPAIPHKDITLPGGTGGGVTAPVAGFFTMSVDDYGNLYAYSADGNIPNFSYDEETGALSVATGPEATFIGNVKGPKGDTGTTGPKGETGATGAAGAAGADGKSAYAYAVEGGYTGTEAEFAAKLAAEMPTTLPNPNALTFTGAVTGSYDGSEPLTVEIPSGGSGGSDAWNLIDHFTVADAAISYAIPLQPGAKEYGIYWTYTQPGGGSTPKRSIMVDSSLALYGVMYRCITNETLFLRVFKGPSNILATGQGVVYASQRFSNGGTNIGSGTDFPAMTLTTDIACATTEIWVYWR